MLRPLRTGAAAATLLVLGTLILAGCGGASKERGGGTSGGGGAPRHVEPADLDTGDYPTEGIEVDKTTGDDLANGRAAEAHRIANVVIDPSVVDPSLQAASNPMGRMASPDEITRLFASEDPKLVATRVSGGVATRRGPGDGEQLSLCIAVMTFDTPAAAATFTKRIGDGNERSGTDPIFRQPFRGVRTALPGHPEARASLYYVGARDLHPSVTALQTKGRMVIYMFAGGPGKQLAATRAMVAKALTMQLDALEDFEPRRLMQLADAKVDPSGVSDLTLPLPAVRGKHEASIPGVWDRNGALHQQTWVGNLREAFDDAELDVMAQGWSNVYRTGSPKQAAGLLDDFEEAMTIEQYRAVHAPKGLREARCFESADPDAIAIAQHVCQVQHGRYVAEFGADTAPEAEDGISAQYLLLQGRATTD